MPLTASLVVWKAADKFIAKTLSHCSWGKSSIGDTYWIPVCVCVCVWASEQASEREREREHKDMFEVYLNLIHTITSTHQHCLPAHRDHAHTCPLRGWNTPQSGWGQKGQLRGVQQTWLRVSCTRPSWTGSPLADQIHWGWHHNIDLQAPIESVSNITIYPFMNSKPLPSSYYIYIKCKTGALIVYITYDISS